MMQGDAEIFCARFSRKEVTAKKPPVPKFSSILASSAINPKIFSDKNLVADKINSIEVVPLTILFWQSEPCTLFWCLVLLVSLKLTAVVSI